MAEGTSPTGHGGIFAGWRWACSPSVSAGWVRPCSTATSATPRRVITVKRTVYRDQVITAADLAVTSAVPAAGLDMVPADRIEQVIGRTALWSTSAEGSLLTSRAFGEPVVEVGSVRIGLRLAAGRLPSAPMPPGTEVLLVPVGRDGAEPPAGASVAGRIATAAGVLPDGASVVDVSVAATEAERVARLAANDQLVLVRLAGSRAMSVLLLTSAGHAPGVTGLGVALALTWPEPVLLVDANREPDQSVLAGHLQGVDPGRTRPRRAAAGAPGASGPRDLPRRDDPAAGRRGRARLPARLLAPGHGRPVRAGVGRVRRQPWRRPGATVLVDAGRITPEGLPPALVAGCSGVAVVTGSRLVDLAALRLYLPLVVAAAGEERVGLVVVGPGRPYGSGEIGHRFGVRCGASSPGSRPRRPSFAAGEPAPRRRDGQRLCGGRPAAAGRLAERASGGGR